LHSVRANLSDKDEYFPLLWKPRSQLVCLYRNIGKMETWKLLGEKLEIPITPFLLKKWSKKEKEEEKERIKRQSKEYLYHESQKKEEKQL